jgi:hypothetical protein
VQVDVGKQRRCPSDAPSHCVLVKC